MWLEMKARRGRMHDRRERRRGDNDNNEHTTPAAWDNASRQPWDKWIKKASGSVGN